METVESAVQNQLDKLQAQVSELSDRMQVAEDIRVNLMGLSEGVSCDICDLSGQLHTIRESLPERDDRVKKLEEDVTEVIDRNKRAEEKASQALTKADEAMLKANEMGKKSKNGEEDDNINKCKIVVRGLSESAKEKSDVSVTMNLVYNVIGEGLELKDVKLTSPEGGTRNRPWCHFRPSSKRRTSAQRLSSKEEACKL